MGKLTDVAIRAWIRSGERFEGRSDGDGLVLTWRPERSAPSWKLRYRFAGKSRVMNLGSYTDLALAAARQSAKELCAKIALGHDVAGEKQERKSTALSRDALVTLFEAMRQAKGFSVQNELAVKLLSLLAVRKGELIAARWNEFDLEAIHAIQRGLTGYPVELLANVVRSSNGRYTMAGMLLAILSGDQALAKRISKIQPRFADCLPPLIAPVAKAET